MISTASELVCLIWLLRKGGRGERGRWKTTGWWAGRGGLVTSRNKAAEGDRYASLHLEQRETVKPASSGRIFEDPRYLLGAALYGCASAGHSNGRRWHKSLEGGSESERMRDLSPFRAASCSSSSSSSSSIRMLLYIMAVCVPEKYNGFPCLLLLKKCIK
ncbi:hypothetical protein B0O99DRAFT_2997 [Bisporella sp. PMI_857]|nr:hypothetical protein B0O99DRAFT_2997 [Bisporella sp. PMI_857]